MSSALIANITLVIGENVHTHARACTHLTFVQLDIPASHTPTHTSGPGGGFQRVDRSLHAYSNLRAS